jgi:hypothetical protein
LVLREGRDGIGRPGFRTRQVPLVTTRLEAETSRVANLADLYRPRWQVESSLAHLKTTRPMEGLHGKTVPGVLKAWTVFALVDHLVRLIICPAATLQRLGVARIRCVNALRWRGAPGPGVP